MITFFSTEHQQRRPSIELHEGQLVTPYESPARVDLILKQIQRQNFGVVKEAPLRDLSVAKQLHDADYIQFLSSCWTEWRAAGYESEIISYIWPGRRMPSARVPSAINGKVGYYSMSADTTISDGTWEAVVASQSVALAATDEVLSGARGAFALCRPPGHHAPRDQFGGYCFLNNAAIAAQQALNHGHSRVAILDIDFHHGNGTQDIFYARDDVLFASLHGDPVHAFPYFLGYSDEIGEGEGKHCNFNYPLPKGTDYQAWASTLDKALQRIEAFNPSLLVVSLGVDTFENDPISFFKLKQADFVDCGQRLGRAGLNTVFVMEGGYAVEDIGNNVVNVLLGFESV